MNNIHKIAIWGYGKEGKSAHKYLINKYPDANFKIITKDNEDTEKDNIQSGYYDLISKSPAISAYRDIIKQAKSNGTIFTSATKIWFDDNPDIKKIVITGTKGKSTTSSLIYQMLRSVGKDVEIAGNFGNSLLDSRIPDDYMVIELSSYQICDLDHFVDYLIITNLFPEHIPWHGNIEQYYLDKLRISKKAKYIIAYDGNIKLVERLGNKSNIIWYGHDDISLPYHNLKGEHNINNLKAVITLFEILNIKPDKDINYIEMLPHRLQEFGVINGNICVNDSISTIPQATIAAMDSYKEQNITLIIGGYDRGQDFNDLIESLSKYKIYQIIMYGQTGIIINSMLKDYKYLGRFKLFNNIESSVKYIKSNLPKKGVILFSPASPSFDQFNNFRERGERFMKLIIS